MKFWIFTIICIPSILFSITAEEIVKAVDKNEVFESQRTSATLTIDRDGKKLVKEMKILGVKGDNKFFIEFTNPEDKGVKYLRIGSELWIYFPDADAVMKISSHMLRQGMMGSDISYEDLMSDEDYLSKYNAVLIGETNVNGAECYKVMLTARPEKQDITYYKRQIVVDKEKMIAVELDLYAKSGRLLKRMIQSDIEDFSGRYYPTKITIEDAKRKNSITTVGFKNLEFNVPIPEGTFTRENLKK